MLLVRTTTAPTWSAFYATDGQATASVARGLDWSAHPLGSPQRWPLELRTTLSTLFNNRQPMFLFWGERHWSFYNDGYIPILSAAKHPWAMGRPGEEVWAEIWPTLIPQIEQVRREGRATWNEDQLIPILKNGVLVDSYFTYSYAPVFREDGTVGGTLVCCMETTRRVRTERDVTLKTEALEKSLNGVDIVDSQGRFVYANQAYLRMWGYDSLDEVLGTSPASHCADPSTPERIIRTLKQEGECDIEFVARRKDGSTFDVRMWARLAHGANGEEIYPTTSIDISAQKRNKEALEQSEARLRESEERLRLALQAAQMGVYERDLATGKVTWSTQARRLLGVEGSGAPDSFEEFLARIPPDDRARFQAEAMTAARDGRSVDISYQYRRPDGQVRWLHAYGRGVTDSDGRPVRAVGVLQDVTAGRRDQEALAESEARFRRIADGMPQIVWTADREGRTTFLNSRWYEYTGEQPSAPVGASDSTHYIHPDELQLSREAWQAALAAGTGYEVELRLRHHSGEYRWHVSRSVPAFDAEANVTGWCGTSTDIHAQKEAERRLEDAVRARDEFLSIASHELKTPLTSLKLQTQAMMRAMRKEDPSVYSPERVTRLVEQTARQTDRLARLVDDMLDVARIETGKLTVAKSKVNLCRLVTETAERLRPQFDEAQASLSVDCPEQLEVEVDAERMEQVVVNLLTNALRYGRSKPVRVEVGRRGELARVAVRDEGIGISAEHQARVFDRFERAISSNEVSGLGLGLYISRQIVERHGGRIFVESEPGRGSTFAVELPL